MISYCSNCIHYNICGNEGVDDVAMTFCAEKQTDGDLISRDYILSKFKEQCDRCGKYKENNGVMCRCCALDDAIDYVEDAPSAEKTTINSTKTTITDGDLISRKAVLKCFNIRELEFRDKEDAELMKHYLELSFNNLAKLPSVDVRENQISGDLISRQAVLDLPRIKHEPIKGYGIIEYINVDGIKKLPSAENTAEWILFDDESNAYECSNCKDAFILLEGTPTENNYNYCPNCGARMKGE